MMDPFRPAGRRGESSGSVVRYRRDPLDSR